MRTTSLLFVLAGCSKGFIEEQMGDMRHLYTRLSSNVAGTAKIKVPIDRTETALLATVQVEAPNQVHFRSVEAPNRQVVFRAFEWNDSPFSKTNAGFVADVVTLNWPVEGEDPGLEPGKWHLEFGVVDAQQRYTAAPMLLDILLKNDQDFGEGRLLVSTVYTDGLEDDEALRDTVNEARQIWQDLYATMGIEIEFNDFGFPVEGLDHPALGTEDAYTNIAQDTPTRSVNLVISERINGSEDEIFGIAGDIPGPQIPTPRSGVQISAVLAAGPDGFFDAEDTRLLAETMAHETAHYLGLFHPVEALWDSWDALDDTPECDSEADCVEELGNNLMFPFPVCHGASCTPQDGLTDEQSAVVNRNVAVW